MVSAQGHAALLPPLQEHHLERPKGEGRMILHGYTFPEHGRCPRCRKALAANSKCGFCLADAAKQQATK